MKMKVKSSAGTGVPSEPYSLRSPVGSIPRIAIACTPRADVHMNAFSSPAQALIPAKHVHMPSHGPPNLRPVRAAAGGRVAGRSRPVRAAAGDGDGAALWP